MRQCIFSCGNDIDYLKLSTKEEKGEHRVFNLKEKNAWFAYFSDGGRARPILNQRWLEIDEQSRGSPGIDQG